MYNEQWTEKDEAEYQALVDYIKEEEDEFNSRPEFEYNYVSKEDQVFFAQYTLAVIAGVIGVVLLTTLF